MLEVRPGFACLRLSGAGASSLLRTEPGGHRWQRVPPGEKRGRVHTSTVTVAVVELLAADVDDDDDDLPLREVRFETYKGTGPGGQHRNKTESCVRAVHVPTGLEAHSESERSQHHNKRFALATLATRVKRAREAALQAEQAEVRRRQVGSGERGDKVRTVRTRDGIVTCERSGQKHPLRAYLRGDLDWLQA